MACKNSIIISIVADFCMLYALHTQMLFCCAKVLEGVLMTFEGNLRKYGWE